MSTSSDNDDVDSEVFSAVSLDPELTSDLAEMVRTALATAGPDYGQAIQTMSDAVAAGEPFVVMGAFATRYGTTELGKNPEYDRRDGMFWHHIELVKRLPSASPHTPMRRRPGS